MKLQPQDTRKRRKEACGFRAAHQPETIHLEFRIVDGSFAAEQLAAEYPWPEVHKSRSQCLAPNKYSLQAYRQSLEWFHVAILQLVPLQSRLARSLHYLWGKRSTVESCAVSMLYWELYTSLVEQVTKGTRNIWLVLAFSNVEPYVRAPSWQGKLAKSKQEGVLPMASRSCKRELRSHWGPWTAQVCELNTLKFSWYQKYRCLKTQDYASTKLLPNDFGTSHRISSLPGHELCPRGDRQSNKLRQKSCFIALGGNGGMHGEPYLCELISVLELVHFMEPKKKHGWQNGKLEGTQETFGRALPKLTSKTCLVRSVHPDNRKIWDIWCMSTFSAEVLYNYSIGDMVGECRKLIFQALVTKLERHSLSRKRFLSQSKLQTSKGT